MIFVDYRSMSKHYMYMLSHDEHKADVLFVEDEDALFPNKILLYLYRLHYSRINSFIEIPLKKIWFRYFIPQKCSDKTNQYCFILPPSVINRHGEDFINFLHSKFNCKVVLVIGDKIESYSEKIDLAKWKQKLDLICTYNPVDSEKYSILLHPGVVYNLMIKDAIPYKNRNTDVFFVGQEKGRGELIVSIYNKCKSLGLNCDFNIVGETSSPHVEGIHYCNWLSYEDVFERMKGTKCILNILQPGASGITQRDTEAYNFGCYLITNNNADELDSIFNEGQVTRFVDIDESFASVVRNREDAFPRRKNRYSLDGFYNWIESSLQV